MDPGHEPRILMIFLVENLDPRCRRCMEEGSRYEAMLWAGRHCLCGPR